MTFIHKWNIMQIFREIQQTQQKLHWGGKKLPILPLKYEWRHQKWLFQKF